MNTERRERMRKAMAAARLDALVLRLPENVLLLSGHWPMISVAFLVFPLEGRGTCFLPACYEGEAVSLEDTHAVFYDLGGVNSPATMPLIQQLLGDQAAGKGWRRIGYEGNFEANAPSWNAAEGIVPAGGTYALLRNAYKDAELVDATALIQTERLTKTAYEIDKLSIAGDISCFAMQAFQDAVAVGVSGVELVALAEQAALLKGTGYKGAVRVRAFAQVSAGAQETAIGHRPNIVSTARRMQDGDFAMLELGLVADGYWADRTRVGIAGTPRDEQIRIFQTVVKAQEAGIAAMKPGVKASDVDEAARSVIRDAGYGSAFPHITGHGLGFGYHETAPILGPHSTQVLEAGMLTSVEPGIYTTAFGGCRIEDDVVVTESGSLVLGPFPKVWQAGATA